MLHHLTHSITLKHIFPEDVTDQPKSKEFQKQIYRYNASLTAKKSV